MVNDSLTRRPKAIHLLVETARPIDLNLFIGIFITRDAGRMLPGSRF